MARGNPEFCKMDKKQSLINGLRRKQISGKATDEEQIRSAGRWNG